jgi:putative aldouronate transport system permease protein
MLTKRSVGEWIFDSANVLFMAGASFLFLYPIWYCLMASISDPAMLSLHIGPIALPIGFSLEGYRLIAKNSVILRGVLNTLFYVTAGTLLNLLMTSFAAYGLSRKKFYWKKPITMMIIFTMYFGGGLIPFFILVKNTLHLADTPFAIILPQAINTFYMIIMRTYFTTIPDSMEESAVIDGANDFTILFRIYLPLALPVVAVLIIYYGVGYWNSWFYASIFLIHTKDWQPLQLLLRDILFYAQGSNLREYGDAVDKAQVGKVVKYALIVITVLPIAMIYPFMQKHFVKGIMIGSIKE